MNKKLIKIFMIFLTLILIGVYCFYENNFIDVEKIELNIKNLGKDMDGLKIAHISDLHLNRNEFFIKQLKETLDKENPDLIFVTGDLIDRKDTLRNSQLKDVCKLMVNYAPTYVISGNHDIQHNYNLWKSTIEESGAIVLDDKIEYYEKGKSKIALMGSKWYANTSLIKTDLGSVKKDIPVLLLVHKPNDMNFYFNKNNSIIPTIAFAGHAHGGQVRIPIINQGIISPNQGFFPKYTSGVYDSPYDNGKLIVSRGLGNSRRAQIRINDRIHLPIITLHCEK